jgi:hypothetical protein
MHTSDESARRRRALLDTVARIEELSAVVLRYRRPAGTGHVAARHLLLQAATGLVVGSGVTAWTLDNHDPAQRARDRASIAHALAGVDRRLRPVYDHRRSRTEPLLWAADAVCCRPPGRLAAARRPDPDRARHPPLTRNTRLLLVRGTMPGALPAPTGASTFIVPASGTVHKPHHAHRR